MFLSIFLALVAFYGFVAITFALTSWFLDYRQFADANWQTKLALACAALLTGLVWPCLTSGDLSE